MELLTSIESKSSESLDMLESYLTVAPSGLESVTSSAIQDALSDYVCRMKPFVQTSQEEIDAIKEKVLQQQKKKVAKQRKKNINIHAIYDARVFGSCQMAETGKELNIGFHGDKIVTATPGGLEGKVLIQFGTDAPPEKVAAIREMGCGPLLALIVTSSQKIVHKSDTLEESSSSLSSFLDNVRGYQEKFKIALDLWAQHAEKVWFQSRDVQDYLQPHDATIDEKSFKKEKTSGDTKKALINLRKKVNGVHQMKYRVSCIRSYTKEYKYTRDEITPHLVSILVPQMTLNDGKTKKFSVDLKNYDFELVVIMNNGKVSIAVALNYYQYVGAKSFCSGKIPPDTSMPYIRGELSKDIIRLRPTIASLIYRLSDIKIGDIVVDPCAGVGTIPIEGSLKRCYALGGDLALSDEGLGHIATMYGESARSFQKGNNYIGGSDLMSWDASLLPLRDASVDVIISDLPFGFKCMSSNKLKNFLPLLLAECGRCLRPSGQMTLLCGSFQGILDALQEVGSNHDCYIFESPTSIIPVNIGGISAWIFQISRSNNDIQSTPNRRRISKMVKGRSQRIHGQKKRRVQV